VQGDQHGRTKLPQQTLLSPPQTTSPPAPGCSTKQGVQPCHHWHVKPSELGPGPAYTVNSSQGLTGKEDPGEDTSVRTSSAEPRLHQYKSQTCLGHEMAQ